MTIQTGNEAPDFELPSNQLTEEGKPGKTIRLRDYRGQNVVLAFYPLDFSPVCSNEMACFRDDLSQFQDIAAQVLGISVDSAWAHLAFARAQGLTFPLLSDFEPKGKVASLYGLYEADRGVASRATVLVDRAGKVVYVKNHGLGNARANELIVSELKKLR